MQMVRQALLNRLHQVDPWPLQLRPSHFTRALRWHIQSGPIRAIDRMASGSWSHLSFPPWAAGLCCCLLPGYAYIRVSSVRDGMGAAFSPRPGSACGCCSSGWLLHTLFGFPATVGDGALSCLWWL